MLLRGRGQKARGCVALPTADKLTGYLKPATLTIYLHGKLDRLILEQRLRPDANGEVKILEAFWDVAEEAAWQGGYPNDTAIAALAFDCKVL